MSNQTLILQSLQATLTQRLAGVAVSSASLPLKTSDKGRYLIEKIEVETADDAEDFSNPYLHLKATVTLLTRTQKNRKTIALRDFDDLPPIALKHQNPS